MTSTSNGRWKRRKESRHHELLAAALDLFVEHGYAATRLEDVASMAGVSKGTLYSYFANKEELFKSTVREHLLPVLHQVEQTIDQHAAHSSELLCDLLRNWWENVGETKLPGVMKLMVAESGNFPEVAHCYHDEVILPRQSLIVGVLARGVACGELRDVDTVQTAQVIVALAHMLMLQMHSLASCKSNAPIVPSVYLNTMVDMLLHGLRSK